MNKFVGRVSALSVSDQKGIPKTNVPEAALRTDYGMVGDVHAGSGIRQLSLLAMESIEKLHEKGVFANPGDFAENITTVGFPLTELVPGDRILIGSVQLEITQIGKECHNRCAIFYAAGDCVMPREGLFARVLNDGTLRTGDPVQLIPSAIPLQ